VSCRAWKDRHHRRRPSTSVCVRGKVDFGGIRKEVLLDYTPEARIGDYVMVHVGFALSIVDEAEATDVFDALRRT
jgi:hydrogenase expression/formation protein HypC